MRKVYHNYKLCVNNKSWPKRGKAQSSAAAVTFFVDGWRSNSAPWSGWWWVEKEKECAILPITAAAHNSTLASFLTLIRTSKWPCKLMRIHILVVYCGARYYYYYYYYSGQEKVCSTPTDLSFFSYTQVHTTSPPCRRWHKKRRWWFSGWLVVLCL